jgi:hypothetical protein
MRGVAFLRWSAQDLQYAISTVCGGARKRLMPGAAVQLQRPLPDGVLKIVATGEKEDPAAVA